MMMVTMVMMIMKVMVIKTMVMVVMMMVMIMMALHSRWKFFISCCLPAASDSLIRTWPGNSFCCTSINSSCDSLSSLDPSLVKSILAHGDRELSEGAGSLSMSFFGKI